MASLSNAWVDAYLEALLSAGLSSEAVLPRGGGASEAGAGGGLLDASAAGDPSAPNVAARYYLQQILAMDEESIQQAWLKVRARSSVRLSGERDARLEHVCWRVWSMRRRAAAPRALRPPEEDESPDASDVPEVRSEAEDGAAVDDEELTKLYGAASPAAATSPAAGGGSNTAATAATAEGSSGGGGSAKPPAAGAALRSAPARAASLAGAAAAVAAKAAAAELPATPLAAASGGGAVSALATFGLPPVEDEEGLEAAGDESLNLGEGRVPKLYCVLISLHGLVRGDRMELGKDPDTGGQVKYVVELARALARHPAVHRVDLLTRLIKDSAVSPDYGVEEEPLDEGSGQLGGAFIVRLPCGPVNKYIRKEALWPHVREFADNALTHTTTTLSRLADAGEACELYTVHGHYADAGEVASLVSATLGVDMVLTGHSLGRNKLDHLLKSRSMTRREIEAAYAISRRIEAEERSLDAAALVFASTRQEVKDQWGLYDGYDPDLERILRARPRRGRHFPVMSVVPPGLDFSGLKIDCPLDPWQQLDGAAAAATAGGGGLGLLLSGGAAAAASPGRPPRSRRTSAVAADDAASTGLPPPPPVAVASPRRSGGVSPATAAALADSPFLRDAPPPDVLGISGGSPSPAAAAAGTASVSAGGPAGLVVGGASPRGPPTPLPGAGGSGTLSPPGGGGGGGVLGTVYEDPPIWREIFRFLRNPRKPVILAMSRPDAKKNIATLVRAYGESPALRQIANLVLVLGNRSVIDSMAAGSARVLEGVLKLVDAYDLYGSVAYPKAHSQEDISHIYLLPHHTRGVFANVALQEPFGLTLIEAAAHGVPIVATTHGGPVDIVATLKNGLLVDPTDQRAVGDALLRLLTDPGLWEQCAGAGRDNIGAYSWPSHCGRCLAAIEREKTRAVTRRKTAMRSTFSVDLDRVADTLQSEATAATAAAAAEAPAVLTATDSTAAEDGSLEAASEGAAAATGPPEVAPPPPGLRRLALGGERSAAAESGSGIDGNAAPAPGAAAPLAAAASLEAWAAGPEDAAAATAAGGLVSSTAVDSAAEGSAADGTAAGSPFAAVSPLRSGGRAASLALSPRAGSLDARAFSAMLAGGAQPLAGLAASPVPLPFAGPVLAPKARYVVLLIDSSDAVTRLSALLSRRGATRALASLAAAGGGARVGVGAASCYPLAETLRLLSSAGLGASDLDFLITNCGAQIFYGGATAASVLMTSSPEAVRTAASPEAAAASPDCLSGLQQCVADEAYGAHIDASWCKISVRRVLAQLLAQPGLLTGLAGSATTAGSGGSGSGGGLSVSAAAAGTAARGPSVRISADTETGAHHLLLTVRRAATAATGPVVPAAAPPALSPRELLSLVARMKKRLRSSGLRTQVTAQLEADGAARLHITPLRASRALGLRFLAHRHGVDMRGLVLVGCARELSGNAAASSPATAAAIPQQATFAASDAEDLLGGVQGVLLAPPAATTSSSAAAGGAAASAAADMAAAPAGPSAAVAGGGGSSGGGAAGSSSGVLQGFAVDLSPHSHDGRVQLLTAAPK